MTLVCPDCGHRFSPPPLAGHPEVTCPQCGRVFAAAATGVAGGPDAVTATVDFSPGDRSQCPADAGRAVPDATSRDVAETVSRPAGPAAPDEIGETVSQAQEPAAPEADSQADADHSAGRAASSAQLLSRLPPIPNYEVLEVIGRGGMGVVLKGRHHVLERLVAIKMPLSKRPADRKRFLREAHSAASLRHPNICSIHEVGEAQGRPYLVMDFIAGQTLREWAAHQRPPARRAAEIIAQLARAVAYAHQHGVIHRDLKPTNVMLDRETGAPVLMDFGLAKEVTLSKDDLTRSGQLLGTPAYMAPEQAAGRQSEIGPASDIYALGAILYELLGGEAPFSGSMGEVLTKVQTREPAPLRKLTRHLHRDLETICLKAMAKRPADRYATASVLAEDLERFCTGEPILARRLNPVVRLGRLAARRPLVTGLVAAAVLLVLVGGWLLARAYEHRQTAALLASLESQLDTGDWSAEGLQQLDAIVEALDRKAPEQAAAGRQRLAAELAAAIDGQLRSPSLPAEQIAAVEASLERLASRDASRTSELRAALQRRLRKWEEVFHLGPPYAGVDAVFDPADVAARDERLWRTEAAPPTAARAVVTRAESSGTVQIEAVFDAPWSEAGEIGLMIDAVRPGPRQSSQEAAEPGYRFVLRGVPAETYGKRATCSLATVRSGGGEAVIEILRDRDTLRSKHIALAALPPGPLRMRATKVGDRLQLEVGSLPAVEFFDPFVARAGRRAAFGVWWPGSVGICELRALRQTMPEAPSPLERGDGLYAEGRLDEALAAYREQVQAFSSAEVSQQARYKEAACLLGLRRQAEAEAILERLALEAGERSPTLAACQLWLRWIEQGRPGETDALIESIAARHALGELPALVPVSMHEKIVRQHLSQAVELNLYKPNPRLIPSIKRTLTVLKFFDVGPWVSGQAQFRLVRAYRVAGQEKEALDAATQFMREGPALPDGRPHGQLAPEYCWLLRVDGRHDEALALADREIARSQRQLSPNDLASWVLDRVRCLAAVGRFADAEQALETLPAETGVWRTSAAALRGLLRERRGDQPGAVAAWKEGLRDWPEKHAGMTLLDGLVICSLSGDISDNIAQRFLKRFTGALAGDSPLVVIQDSVGEYILPPAFVASIMRASFRSPRGRDLAPKILLRTLPMADCLRPVPRLLIYETIAQGPLSGHVSPEQDEVLWEAAGAWSDALIQRGAITKTQLLQIAFTWKGMTNYLGWAGVAPTLAPDLRGAMEYFMGHRYLRLNRPDDARTFFRAALKDAAAGSPLGKLAQAELDRSSAPSPKPKADGGK